MELYQLSCFREVARSEHMTQAAERLHLSQPALSKLIRRLEDDLGAQLFQRDGRNIRLTESGRLVANYAETVLAIIGDMQSDLEELRTGQAGEVFIGTAFTAEEPNWLSNSIRSYSIERPNIAFSLKEYAVSDLVRALNEREIELALSYSPLNTPGIEWIPLYTERVGVILARSHPLAQKVCLSIADLRNERFYCNNANSGLEEMVHRFCSMGGFTPNIHFRCQFSTYIGEAVSLGYGISMISEEGYQRTNARRRMQAWEDEIVYRPLQEDYCRYEYGIAKLQDRHLGPSAQQFLNNLLEKVRKEKTT